MSTKTGRHILLVSYHFGPGCPTGGFRWNATAEHLCSHGWDIDVITVARDGLGQPSDPVGPGSLRTFPVEPVLTPTRIKAAMRSASRWLKSRFDQPAPPTGHPTRAVDPRELFVWQAGYRRSLRERLSHGLDYIERAWAELAWSRQAVRVARPLLRSGEYRAIVVSSPPHLTHAVGARLAREFRVPYIADYRDPWTLGLGPHVGYVSDLERIIGRHFETRTLRRAHTVIHNTERARAAVAAEFRIPGNHIAIRNGYDETAEVETPDPKCFRVVYTGHLYPFMDVRSVFAACSRLRERHDLGAQSLRIDFVGAPEQFEGVALTDLADAYGLGDVFNWHPRLPPAKAAEFQQAASVLVAYDWLFPVAVVSKFYEYARMKGSLLLLGNTDGALADAAAEVGLRVLDAGDDVEIDQLLEAALARWRSGDFDHPNDTDRVFERTRQSRRIREVLEAL